MTALTIAQFTADTIFGFVCRIVGTFLGALLGMVIWYIGSGSGMGNAYGLLTCLAVCIPFMMFIRVNFVCPFDITNTGLFNANASNHLLHYRHPHHWI
jgi:hypothetical protein